MSESVPASVEVHHGGLGAQLPFVLRLECDPKLTVITLNGELDIATASELDEAIATVRANAPEEVLLDLSGLSFLDSSGIRALLRVRAMCEGCGCHLALVRGTAQVQKILTLARVSDRFVFAD